MRDLSADANIIEIQDGTSGDVHEIRYRMPTNQERTAYGAQLWKREGRKLKNQTFETRIKFGRRIITGFKKGTLGVNGRPFASEPGDPDYRQDWLDLLCRDAGDVVSAVAHAVFERTGQAVDPTMFDLEDGDIEDDDSADAATSVDHGENVDPL